MGAVTLPPKGKGNVSTEWQLFPGINNVASRIDEPSVRTPENMYTKKQSLGPELCGKMWK